ncbi:60 kDa lysophospholipase isoform X3 [Diceros bicornis minor]|uniref:60 kDa lysophospholipase isoform X3 n=1 Tax=Diceros bicornis minor TaxID=77932 RepID=UPI0026EC35D9|nr:60 kDa lysophospholipase isoform X3 [Diceros bicornis minor]
MARAAEPERRLLAVYTGGTIGMRSERGVLIPGRGLAAVLRTLPMFHDEEHAQACGLPEDTLVLPPARPDQRILYTVLECQPLFDSSDMTITEWVQIAQTIERHYEQYDGFVVIHGTDTMAFAASVLSFVLENLQKTVILTGAQVPIHALWNDGRENLLGALLMAGQYVIPEVCLFFQNQLFRGNRVTKVDARRFAAFCSPNLPPLAVVGADVIITRELVRKVRGPERLVVHSSMERDVGLLRLYPGIPAALMRVVPGADAGGRDCWTGIPRSRLSPPGGSWPVRVRAFLQPPLKGVVMETFGSGNGPTKPDLLQELRAAAERGLVIVNCTHCLQGAVTSDYAAGMAVAGAGIVSGFDMTSEAALAKLSYVLGQPGLSLDSRKELLARDLRGEMTLPAVDEHRLPLPDSMLGHGVAQLLSLSQGSDLSLENFNGQTPLHAAARGGHAGVVTMLLQSGVDVSARDEDGLSPLLLAVRGRAESGQIDSASPDPALVGSLLVGVCSGATSLVWRLSSRTSCPQAPTGSLRAPAWAGGGATVGPLSVDGVAAQPGLTHAPGWGPVLGTEGTRVSLGCCGQPGPACPPRSWRTQGPSCAGRNSWEPGSGDPSAEPPGWGWCPGPRPSYPVTHLTTAVEGASHGQDVPRAWRGPQISLLHPRTHWAGCSCLPSRLDGPGPQLTPPSPTPSSGAPEDAQGWLGLLGSSGPCLVKGWAPPRRCPGLSVRPAPIRCLGLHLLSGERSQETSHFQEVLPAV